LPLGTALIAPIVTLEPGNPARPNLSPGTIFLTAGTYKALLSDMAASLRSQGFTDIVLLGDSGGNLGPMKEVAATLNAEWKGQGAVEEFERTTLGIHEKSERHHRDRGYRRHPDARAGEGRQVQHQRRAARAHRQDD